jgi:hypothetical protein
MGEVKRKRERFFEQHPWCCFCGGGTKATTIDHVPSRGLFLDRIAPERYEFPACANCQAASANIEQLIAFVSKLSPREYSREQRADFQRRVKAIRNNFPQIIEAILYSPDEVERIVREQKIPLPPGVNPRQVPLANLNHPQFRKALETYARKLILALHYLHVEAILPSDGGMLYGLFTSLNRVKGELPAEMLNLPGVPVIRRQKTVLSAQFNYRYGVERGEGLSAFFVALGDSIVISGVAITDLRRHELAPTDRRVHLPFSWSSS